MSITQSSVRVRQHGLKVAIRSSLASASLAVCLLHGPSVLAQEQVPVGESAREEPSQQQPVQAAPTVPTNAPTPGAVAREPVAKADDAEFDSSEESSQAAFNFSEPTFRTETTRKRIPNIPLLATGTLVLAGAYVPAVVGGAISDRAGDNKLYIPVAGPFLAMNRGADEKPGYKALFVADGIAQGIGGLGMLLSVMIPEKITRSWNLIGNREISVAPGRIARGYGLVAAGRF